MKSGRTLLSFSALLFMSLAAHASSLSTGFSSKNGYDANFFTLTVQSNGVTLTGFDINILHDTDITILVKTGDYVGYESSLTGWTSLGSYSVFSAGDHNASNFFIMPYTLDANTAYSVEILDANLDSKDDNLRAIKGAGTVSNDDLNITGGEAFDEGGVVHNKLWSGTVYYDVNSNVAATPEPSSIALLGTGIAGIAGTLRRRRNSSL